MNMLYNFNNDFYLGGRINMKKILFIIITSLLLFTTSFSAKPKKFKDIKTLYSTSWKLVKFDEEILVTQYIGSRRLGEITLIFPKKGAAITGNSGVNTYYGDFGIEGENISFSNISATEGTGPRNVMDQEYRYLNVLGQIVSYKISDKTTLILTTSDGKNLIFTRI